MYNTVPTVNNKYCALKNFLKRTDSILSVLIIKIKGAQGNSGKFGICLLPDCCDGITSVCICPNLSLVHMEYVQFFVYQLYCN